MKPDRIQQNVLGREDGSRLLDASAAPLPGLLARIMHRLTISSGF